MKPDARAHPGRGAQPSAQARGLTSRGVGPETYAPAGGTGGQIGFRARIMS